MPGKFDDPCEVEAVNVDGVIGTEACARLMEAGFEHSDVMVKGGNKIVRATITDFDASYGHGQVRIKAVGITIESWGMETCEEVTIKKKQRV